MPNLNKVTIAGHLGRDPETRFTTSGLAVCTFSVAITEKGRGENAQEKTTWIDCKAWRDTAELIAENFKKGSAIHIEGKLDVESWDDKQSGQKRSKTVIVVNSASIPLYRKKDQSTQARPASKPAAQPAPAPDVPPAEQDDVPF